MGKTTNVYIDKESANRIELYVLATKYSASVGRGKTSDSQLETALSFCTGYDLWMFFENGIQQ